MAAAVILVERPRKASLSLLLLFIALLFTHAVVLSHIRVSSVPKNILLSIAPVASLVSVVVILNMPLRDPALSRKNISPVSGIPTVELRTPEDNLTPWQYMAVTWMAPLIDKGLTHEMKDEDVWDLGFEFKHERLHNAFKKLGGSVTRRIFVANGMDLIRSSFLSLVQLAASKDFVELNAGTRSD